MSLSDPFYVPRLSSTMENKPRAFLESKRWLNGPVCLHCGCTEIYAIAGGYFAKHQ